MNKVQVRFGEWIEDGFTLYKSNFGVLVLASLIACLVSGVTFFILLGPMMAGFCLITLDLIDQKAPKPKTSQVFNGLNYFLNTFLFVLVWGIILMVGSVILSIIPVIGGPASLLFYLAVCTLTMFAIFLIVDKGMAFWPASLESINMVKTNFWPFLGLYVVSSIIGSIGVFVFFFGIIITLPFQFCILAVAYRKVFTLVSRP